MPFVRQDSSSCQELAFDSVGLLNRVEERTQELHLGMYLQSIFGADLSNTKSTGGMAMHVAVVTAGRFQISKGL
jgi:hypothetical protein